MLLEFMAKNGSEKVIEGCRDRMLVLKELKSFTQLEGGVDKAASAREKVKQFISFLGDNELIRTEREKARVLRHKFVGLGSSVPKISGIGSSSDPYFGKDSPTSFGNSSIQESSHKKESKKSKKNEKSRTSTGSSRNKKSDSEDESDKEDRKQKSSIKSTGGKLKVHIKSSSSSKLTKSSAASPAPAAPAPEIIDLLGDSLASTDFFSTPSSTPLSNNSNFGTYLFVNFSSDRE